MELDQVSGLAIPSRFDVLMCGIAGFFGHFDLSLLVAMNDLIAHRGPDGDGMVYLRDYGVGLAHRRLAIIDLSSSGAQPMWDDAGHACITFNGEIYNFRELRSQLECSGVSFRGHSDTEVLLYLYLRDGEAMLSQLNGIYAFAIWDTVKHTLFIARDGMGVKPLYYTETPSGILFASELKALLLCPEVDRNIDAIGLFGHLTCLWSPAPHTMLRGVKKLEPGMALRMVNGHVVKHWRHYSLPFDQTVAPMADSEVIPQVRESVRTAVHRQMVADVPVGALLSGGLDSSAVVAFAREVNQQTRLQCFTIDIASEPGTVSDLPYARKAATHLDVDLHEIRVGPEMVDELETMLYHLDEPQADPAPLHVLFMSRLARETGIKVLLSGAGGDDLFAGYRRHQALMLEPWWSWLPRPARAVLATAGRSLPATPVILRRLGKALHYVDRGGNDRLTSYFYWLDPGIAREMVSPLTWEVPILPLAQSLAELPAGVSPLNQMLYLECRHFLADHNLNYTDKMSMAAGVEVRVPLLDPDLVRLAARLPISAKIRGGQGKWSLRESMRGILPKDILHRPKTGFGAPLRAWLHGPLSNLMDDVFSSRSLQRRGLFSPLTLQKLRALDRTGRIDAAYPLFAVLCIELWCRIFLDRALPKSSGNLSFILAQEVPVHTSTQLSRHRHHPSR